MLQRFHNFLITFLRDREMQMTALVVGAGVLALAIGAGDAAIPWVAVACAGIVASAAIAVAPRAGLFGVILLLALAPYDLALKSTALSDTWIIKLYLLDVFLVVSVAGLLVRRHSSLAFGWVERLLVLFSALAMVSFFDILHSGAGDPAVAFSTFKNYAFYPLLALLLTRLAVRTRDEAKDLGRVFAVAGGIAFVFFLIGIVRGAGLMTEYTPLSTEGTRLLFITHAWCLVVLFFLVVPRWMAQESRARWLGGLATLFLILAGIAGSFLRHLWIAVGVGVLCSLLIAPREARMRTVRRLEIPVAVFLLCGIAVLALLLLTPESMLGRSVGRLVDPYVVRVASLFAPREDPSALWRIELWNIAKATLAEEPVLGVGFGRALNFTFRDPSSDFIKTYTIEMRNLHNSFLALIIQMGVLGAFVFSLVPLLAIGAAFRRRHNDDELRPWFDGLIAIVIVYLIAMPFEPYLETNFLSVPFWLVFGFLRAATCVNEPIVVPRHHFGQGRHLRMLESSHRRGLAS